VRFYPGLPQTETVERALTTLQDEIGGGFSSGR
jgi:hypothetical protein